MNGASRLYLTILIFFFLQDTLKPQPVTNDSIKNSLELDVNASFYKSTTAQCTIEWGCVDKVGLKGTITIHNDQWFHFTTTEEGSYYINIKNQLCRDKHGVQVMVIDGVPCEIKTYKNVNLASKLSLDDNYYALENLMSNHKYLVSIDGLLGDFCDFEIGITNKPPPYALYNISEELKNNVELKGNNILLTWSIDKAMSDTLEEFLVYKKINELKATKAGTLNINTLTFGSPILDYEWRDTLLAPGLYSYQIIARSKGDRNYLVKNIEIRHFPRAIPPNKADIFTFKSSYKGIETLTFQIYNKLNDKLLKTMYFKNKKHKTYEFDFSRLKSEGFLNFRIVVSYKAGKKEYLF